MFSPWIVIEMEDKCLECGASTQDGMNCWEQLGGILAWEAHDTELAAEHFLTVACYNLQHPAQFTDEAMDALRAGFKARMDEGVSTGQLRRQMSNQFEGSKRVLKRESEQQPVLRQWRMTIANVYLPGHPEGAAERVRQWAKMIRQEL